MELHSRNIHCYQTICQSDLQITLEDDRNVPDSKPDAESLVKTQGDVQITDVSSTDGKAIIRGVLSFQILYTTTEEIQLVHNLSGEIPFEETVNMDNLQTDDDILCHTDLEDCQASLINSRKISIRALLSIHCCKKTETKLEAGTNISDTGAAMAEMEDIVIPAGLHLRHQNVTFTELAGRKRDILRIKDETMLPKGKSNIDSVLYYEIAPQNLQNRLTGDGVRVTGDLSVFVLYTPEDDERRLEYFETELPFDEVIHCDECDESMIPDFSILTGAKELNCKPDDDGENRVIELELILKLEMKFYQDVTMQLLEDAFSTACELKLERTDTVSERLLLRNQSTARISDRIPIEKNAERILQLCSTTGKVQIDEQSIVENGIQLEGVVLLDILYITENDDKPLSLVKGIIPFSHFIEVRGIKPQDYYELQSDVSQISVMMLDSEEIEAKVILSLCALVFTKQECRIITGIEEAPLDLERLHKMPGLVGLIVNEDVSLWNIAKKYGTTPESIKELNHLERDILQKGDKVLLMKMVEGV